MTSVKMPVDRMRMRPWLEQQITSGLIQGLHWVNEVSLCFLFVRFINNPPVGENNVRNKLRTYYTCGNFCSFPVCCASDLVMLSLLGMLLNLLCVDCIISHPFLYLQEKKIFQIPWMHAARHGWELDKDAPLFMNWAIHTGIGRAVVFCVLFKNQIA